MIIIEKDYNSPNRYVVKAKEPGTGWRGWKVIANNLEEVNGAIEHYYAIHGHLDDIHPACAICRTHREEAVKTAKPKKAKA